MTKPVSEFKINNKKCTIAYNFTWRVNDSKETQELLCRLTLLSKELFKILGDSIFTTPLEDEVKFEVRKL
jgi:hypothetical protein